MNKLFIVILSVLLSGCVDTGTVGSHPSVKNAYFSGNVRQVEDCLEREAYRQNLLLEKDDPSADGDRRFNLLEKGTLVAWLEASHFGHHQTSVYAYYGKQEAEVDGKISAMFKQCERELE
ncbi:hypothetical protein AAH446_06185 [Erwinia sp. P6884]|uniref:hypothetical protein n=1 Tax=Erwinia sp. P6884 TaxID=3141450 RepID=UPI003191D53E